MLEENKRIERLAKQGDYQEAALRFMQMTKSMCRHFVEDEHYNYFDDMYNPEYTRVTEYLHINRMPPLEPADGI